MKVLDFSVAVTTCTSATHGASIFKRYGGVVRGPFRFVPCARTLAEQVKILSVTASIESMHGYSFPLKV